MPVITSVRRNVKNAGRCSIFVDEVFLAACPIEVALSMGLRKGLEMSPEMERQLRSEDRKMVFKQKAYRFATYKPRTERQVTLHLEKIGCVPEEVAALMTWLLEFRLIDDRSYAERFIQAAKERKPLSRSGARSALIRKGIPSDIVDGIIEAEYSDAVSLDSARRVAEKKLRVIRASTEDEKKQKLVRFMQYRGFSWDVIRTVVADLLHISSLAVIVAILRLTAFPAATIAMTLFLWSSACAVLSAQGATSCDRRALSSSINHYQPTTLPVVSPDGTILYVDRKLHPDNSEGVTDNDDIWTSHVMPSGEWSSLVHEPLTTFRRPDALFNFTLDGRSALVVGRYTAKARDGKARDGHVRDRNARDGNEGDGNERDSVQCFAVISRDADTGLFTRVNPIVLPGDQAIGKNFYGHIAEDRSTLLLAMKGNDSRGDLDLYVVMKCKDGWQVPVSLGNDINTTSFEGSPWLGRDNRTLYFASSGREDRRGKSDIYMARRIGEGWTRWTTPLNLGPCVNTTEDETSLSIINNSDTALVTSWDFEAERPAIYKVSLPSTAPQPYVVFSAIVRDAVTGEPISLAEMELTDSSETCKAAQLVSVVNGSASAVLKEHTRYTIRTKAKHYVTHEQVIGVREIDSITPLVLTVRVFDTRRPLASVYFDRGSDILSDGQRYRLDSILSKYEVRNIDFAVVGYTDEVGSRPFNETLSAKRANTITSELVRLGINAKRVSASGRGIEMLGLSTGLSENPASRRVDIFPAAR